MLEAAGSVSGEANHLAMAIPAELEGFCTEGQAILAQLSPQEKDLLLGSLQSLVVGIAQSSAGEVNEQLSRHFAVILRHLHYAGLRARQASLTAESPCHGAVKEELAPNLCEVSALPEEGAEEAKRTSWEARKRLWEARKRLKKSMFILGGGLIAVAGPFVSYLSSDPWVQTLALSTSAAVVYASNGIVGPLLELPPSWGYRPKLGLRSGLGAGVVFVGNVLCYMAIDIGMEPNSPVNLIALGSLMNLVGGLVGTYGNLIFFNQKPVWTVWVGLVATAVVATLQISYAMKYQRPPS